jgi:putative transcriptional regulator
MSNAEYMADGQYLLDVVNSPVHPEMTMIEIRVDELLTEHGRTFYWLAKETGISHTTLWRLKKGKALGINFETLEKICETLNCKPGDILTMNKGKDNQKGRSSKKVARPKGKKL